MSKTTARTAGLIKRVAEATIRKHAASPLTSTPEFWERIVSTVLEEAAAPDLLEVAHMIDAWGNGLRHPTEHERKTVNAARAAIAKAEGLKVMTDSKTSTTETTQPVWSMTFRQQGDFAATNAAERFLEARGFAIGGSQHGAPRGVMFGDYVVMKWRNLSSHERSQLHGALTGDGRSGPITVALFKSCPPEGFVAIKKDHCGSYDSPDGPPRPTSPPDHTPIA